MKVVNHGSGIHRREIKGIDYLIKNLPIDWVGHTNLDLSLPQGPREIDVVLFSADRIFLIDLKDGYGRYESVDGGWSLNGVPQNGPSPVKKMLENAREVYIRLDRFLEERAKNTRRHRLPTPKVVGVVVLTSSTDLSGISPTEDLSVFTVKHFCDIVKDTSLRIGRFNPVAPDFVATPIYSEDWRRHLDMFFNVKSGVFVLGMRKYGGYAGSSGAATYVAPSRIYQEFAVEDDTTAKSTGLLRVWDFSKAETRFQTQDGRWEIAGRERAIIGWLNDRNEDCANAVLQPKAEEQERSPQYWEVYDQRRRMKRLSEFVRSELPRLRSKERIDIARQLLLQASYLHTYNAAHLNLADHSVWVALPSEVKLSHLMAARYPQATSLGDTRYQFLSTVKSPEEYFDEQDSTGEQRDVYHLGCLVHKILFGVAPNGEPSDWDPSIDSDGTYANLHHVLEHALMWDVAGRYTNAIQFLDAFNSATEPPENGAEVLKRLESFRTIQSQMKFFMQFPLSEEVKDDDFVTIWRSQTSEGSMFVKLWKRASWADGSTDQPRILDFLERARHYSITHPPGCVPIKSVYWFNDAFALVQPFVEATDLTNHALLSDKTAVSDEQALKFALELVQTVISLHEAGVSHGDLKPKNILIYGDNLTPSLVDYIDFCSSNDGELLSTAYAPATGGTIERDRFAVTKIVEELIDGRRLSESVKVDIIAGILKCRGQTDLTNATLLPLLDALQRALSPSIEQKARQLSIGLQNVPTGKILPDDGGFGYGIIGSEIFIRGLTDVLYFKAKKSKIVSARHSNAPQVEHRRLYARQLGVIQAEISMQGNVTPSYRDFQLLFAEPEFSEILTPPNSVNVIIGEQEETDDLDPTDLASSTYAETDEDAVTELVESNINTQRSSIPELWRSIVDIEASLTNEARAVGPSTLRRENGIHAVPIVLMRGHFEFDKRDRIDVERLGNDRRWRKIGILDLSKSSAEFIHIEAPAWLEAAGNLVDQDQQLRFTSTMENANITRRDAAVKRILARRSIVPNLIDYFDPACSPELHDISTDIDISEIMATYGLNNSQATAFEKIFKVRPLGLLQGPPGTGKTKFIGALIHYALTRGLVRNVLLSSQSHEAVNNAAESVLKLFPKGEETPSILRIGQEDDVSEQLLPYHVLRVEQLYKDNFKATLKSRLVTAADAIGLPEEAATLVIWVETSVRPVAEALNKLAEDTDAEGALDRMQSQLDTLTTMIRDMDVDIDLPSLDQLPVFDLLDSIYSAISDKTFGSPDGIAKLRAVAVLTRDIVSSISTSERSFETFLAGTRQIVAGTCVGLGRSSLGLTSTAFDLVVIDEAARCTASELAVPMQAGRWVVLVGDQAQLQPRIDESVLSLVAEKTGYSAEDITESAFQTVFESGLGGLISQRLLTQYRSLPAIGRVVSNSFYGQALQPGRLISDVPDNSYPPALNIPLTWVYTDQMGAAAFQKPQKNGSSKSLVNPVECNLIAGMLMDWDQSSDFLNWLETKTEREPAIGIICSYSAQASAIRHKLQLVRMSDTMRAAIKVGTVDSYQGKENRIIILSLVRNNADGHVINGKRTIRPGFMSRPNRINVAASRAMDRLIIVGARDRWASDGPMATLRNNFQKEVNDGLGVFLEASQMMQSQTDALSSINLIKKADSKKNSKEVS